MSTGNDRRRDLSFRQVIDEYRKMAAEARADAARSNDDLIDRKSTRLNSSHRCRSYAVFCVKKKTREPDAAPIDRAEKKDRPRAQAGRPDADADAGRAVTADSTILVCGARHALAQPRIPRTQ